MKATWRLMASLLLALTFGSSCINNSLVTLVGEGPGISKLLGKKLPTDPRMDPLAAAQRLHLALSTRDSRMVWALLAQPTRKVLNERAALVGTSGQELLESGALPTSSGALVKVRYETVFFGKQLARIKAKPNDKNTGPDQRVIFALSTKGKITPLVFLKEDDGWKLLKTKL